MVLQKQLALAALCVLGLLQVVVAAPDCLIRSSKHGTPSQNLDVALRNASCPVKAAYNQLYSSNNISSVVDSSNEIISTLKDTTVYLNASSSLQSSKQMDEWRAPETDFPLEVEQWVQQLTSHKALIVKRNLRSSLYTGLNQQRDAAQDFIDVVVSKVDRDHKAGVKTDLSAAVASLNHAIRVFSSSNITSTVFGHTATLSTAAPSGTTAEATTTMSEGTTTQTTSTSTIMPSSTKPHSGAGTLEHSMSTAFLVAVVFWCFYISV